MGQATLLLSPQRVEFPLKGRREMINYLNGRVKKLDVLDIVFTKLSVIVVSIGLVKFLPLLMTIRFRVLLVLLVIFAARPVYSFLVKK
jgi:hypothetical protein